MKEKKNKNKNKKKNKNHQTVKEYQILVEGGTIHHLLEKKFKDRFLFQFFLRKNKEKTWLMK